MKKFAAALAVSALLTGTALAEGMMSPEEMEIQARTEGSRTAVKAFFGQLKGQLVKALEEGGPVQAIHVCKVAAPQIAAGVSEQTGWQVARTSLKLRNSDNAPDEWERAVLEQFEQRKAAGEDVTKMEHAELVEMDGKRVFRYMKAIPTAEKPCLVCHGGNIPPQVTATLDELYPQDQARGFQAGDIRGAFTIIQPRD